MRVTHHWTLGVLLLISADLLTPAPDAFSWESSNLFVDAAVRVARQEVAAGSVFSAWTRGRVEVAAADRSSASVSAACEALTRGILRPRIKRDPPTQFPPPLSEDHQS